MKLRIIIISLSTLSIFGCKSDRTENEEKETPKIDITKQGQKQQINVKNKEVEPIDKNYLILDNSVGKYKIGDLIPYPEIPDNYEIKKESQVRMTEEGPEEETIYIVNEKSNDLLKIKPEYDYESRKYSKNIGEIIILSPMFKTENGIGINSTIEEFVNAYPNYRIWHTYVSGVYVIDTKDINAQFILNEKDFIGKSKISSDMTILKKSDFKTNSKISKIRVIKTKGNNGYK